MAKTSVLKTGKTKSTRTTKGREARLQIEPAKLEATTDPKRRKTGA